MLLNRLNHQKANLNFKQDSLSRKARTRTLIQLGGLIEKSRLTHLLDIPLGIDLEKDEASREKACVILGILLNACEELSADTHKDLYQELHIKGLLDMKYDHIRKQKLR